MSNEVKKGNVVYNESMDRKYVARQDRELSDNEQIVCQRPHEDEDFSYMCGSDYCKCTQ